MSVGDACHPFKSSEARERYLAFYDAQAAALWRAGGEVRAVTTAYGETFMRIAGPLDAPPLVLLPGSRANSLCWSAIAPALTGRFRVYALDAIYDVGRSVNCRPVDTSKDVVDWLDGVLDALGLDRVSMMGLSLGGWATAEYTLHAPSRLSKAIWLAPAGVVLPISAGFIVRGLSCMIPTRATFGGFLRWIMPDAASAVGPVREYFDAALDDIMVASASFAMRPMPGGTPRVLSDLELASIDTPVCYVVGEHERVCSDPDVALARMESVAPHIERVRVSGAGHDLFWVKAHEVSAKVSEFLLA